MTNTPAPATPLALPAWLPVYAPNTKHQRNDIIAWTHESGRLVRGNKRPDAAK